MNAQQTGNSRSDYIVFGIVILLLIVVNVTLLATGRLPMNWEGLGIMIAAGITIGMYSVLYKDNVMFKAVEHVFIGVAGAYMLYLQWHNVFWPEIIRKIYRLRELKKGEELVLTRGWG